MKIALIPGRFQPLTLAHSKMIESAINKYDKVFVYVIGGGSGKSATDPIRNPIKIDLRMKIINSVFNNKIILKNFTSTNLDKISDEIIEDLPEGRHQLTILAGSDRSTYDRQLKYIDSERLEANVSSFGEERTSEDIKAKYEKLKNENEIQLSDISASLVRYSVKVGDREFYNKIVPKQMYNEFDELKEILGSLKESRGFLKKLLNEMTHIEDLKIKDFMDFIKNIYKAEASLKLDGTAALQFGFTDNKFWTAYGRDFKSVKEENKHYSLESWDIKYGNLIANAGKSAHAALLTKLDIIRDIITDETIMAEIMFGDKPNCIKYDFKGVNYLVIHNNSELAQALKGEESVKVDNFILGVDDVETKSVTQKWNFGDKEIIKINPDVYNIDIVSELKQLEDFLSSTTEGETNLNILAMAARGKKKEMVRRVREKAADLKLNIKLKLVDQFLKNINSNNYKTADDYDQEGVVLKLGDKMTKIIDKEGFTSIHNRDWEPVKLASKISKEVKLGLIDKEEGRNDIQDLIDNFNTKFPDIKEPETKDKMIDNLRMSKMSLKESMNAVDDVSRITREEIPFTMKQIEKVLNDLGIKKFTTLGSVGKKPDSGDIDLAVELDDVSYMDVYNKLKSIPDFITDRMTKNPNTMSFGVPIYDSDGKTDRIVQIDFMFGSIPWKEFSHYSPSEGESEFKGAHIQILKTAIWKFARPLIAADPDLRWAISPAGLNKKRMGEKEITRGKNKGKMKSVKTYKTSITNNPERAVALLNLVVKGNWKVEDFEKSFEYLWDKTIKYFPEKSVDLIGKDVANGLKNSGLEVPEILEKYLTEMKINLKKSIFDQMSIDFKNI